MVIKLLKDVATRIVTKANNEKESYPSFPYETVKNDTGHNNTTGSGSEFNVSSNGDFSQIHETLQTRNSRSPQSAWKSAQL